MVAKNAGRMPAWFLTHGGGPLPILGDKQHADMVRHWKLLAKTLPSRPKAILLISAHDEEDVVTVSTGEKPATIHDYHNFPPEAYKLQYPAPGDPTLAKQVVQLFRNAGWDIREDSQKGFDHGVSVPLTFIFPDADVPVVLLSLMSNLNAKKHIELGEVIAPQRDEGVLVIGSGSSWHNLRGMDFNGGPASKRSKEFDDWLQETLAGDSLSPEDRKRVFSNWLAAPHARYSHPREDHLLPAHVVLGSAKGSQATVMYEGSLLGAAVSAYQWA